MPQAWKPKKRRRCHLEPCNALYWPKQKNQRFCSSAHKTEYHQKTPTFRKLKDEIVKLMRATLRAECFK